MDSKTMFIQGVRENPEDENHRLIYADYLEEQGDARGELIRLQCELPKLDVMDPKWRVVRNRIQELLDLHGERWLAPLRELGANRLTARCFQRGLLERVVIDAAKVRSSIEALCDLEPALAFMDVHLQSEEDVAALALMPIPKQITAIDLSHRPLGVREVWAISRSVWMGQLTELNMQNNAMTDEAARMLREASLEGLQILRLGGNQLTSEVDLAFFATLPSLHTLELDRNPLGPEGARQIAEAKPVRIQNLNIAATNVGDAGAQAICDAGSNLVALETLNARSNQFTIDGVGCFAGNHPLVNLRKLDLRSNLHDKRHSGYGGGGTPDYSKLAAKLQKKYGAGVLL